MAENPYIFDTGAEDFSDRVLKTSERVPVLVDFWAAWCGPCRSLAPVLEQIANAFSGRLLIAKVDTDAEPDLAARFGVRSLPTMVLFADGKPQAQTMGAQPEAAIRAFVEPFVSTPGDDLAHQASEAVSRGELDEGRRLLEEAVASEPDRPGPRFALAELMLAVGDPEGAKKAIDPLNAAEKETDIGHLLRDKIAFAEALVDAPGVDELIRCVTEQPDDLEARYLLGARFVLEDKLPQALEQFYEIMRRNRSFRDDAGRSALVACFNMMEPESELAAEYRRKMAALLY